MSRHPLPAISGYFSIPALLLVVAACTWNSALAAQWSVSIDESNGLPVVSRGGLPALSGEFVFWGRNWLWANLDSSLKIVDPLVYKLAAKSESLGFDLAGKIGKESTNSMSWEFTLDARETFTDVIGGGMQFTLNTAAFATELGEPALLPDNRGWVWGRSAANRVEMRFEPAMASVYFEGGRKSALRAFFFKDQISKGVRKYKVTLSTSENSTIAPTRSERYGLEDATTWPECDIDWQKAPVDLSILNAPGKPAGKHGFLKAQGTKLAFEDGTEPRFWGTALTAYALFATSKDAVRQQARRLSALGFNLVRIHHHDSSWVNPNIFGDASSPDTRTLSAAMLDKLDWWIKCLKDEGIYVWLDLNVGRLYKAGDRIDGFDEIRKGNPTADPSGYNYVNSSIEKAMKEFNEAYLTHRSTYTGLRLADEPAIAALLMTNENDITHHYGNNLLGDKNVPWHNAAYLAQANAFAKAHSLPEDEVWRSWTHGPAKLFLNDLEHRFDVAMISQVRKLGAKAPVATTNYWGDNPISSLPALTTGDVIDVHSYGRAGELEKHPYYAANMIDWIAVARVAGKPLTVTEWNVEPFPTSDRHSIPLYVAGTASLQDWNALVQYAYSQGSLDEAGAPSNWHSYNDPALLASLPAAALLYRQKHVKPAKNIYAFVPDAETLFRKELSPANFRALRTIAEQSRFAIVMPETKELPWLAKGILPENARPIKNPDESFLDENASEVVSDTGELKRNFADGTYIVNTPLSQIATGWIGGKKLRLQNLDAELLTRHATVAIQSLDETPIGASGRILISLGGRAQPRSSNQMPFHCEPMKGNLSILARKGMKLYSNVGQGRKPKELDADYRDGRYRIELSRIQNAHWLMLK